MVPLWVTRHGRQVAWRLLLDSLGGLAVNSKATGFTVLERLLLAFSIFFACAPSGMAVACLDGYPELGAGRRGSE
jgi:hypothetical protein